MLPREQAEPEGVCPCPALSAARGLREEAAGGHGHSKSCSAGGDGMGRAGEGQRQRHRVAERKAGREGRRAGQQEPGPSGVSVRVQGSYCVC